MAKDLGVPARDVIEMEKRMSGGDTSFDGLVDADADDDDFAPKQYLEYDGAGPLEQAEADQSDDEDERQLATALESLDARSKSIIVRRWLDEKKSTLQDLADEFGVSAERVRQLEQNALKKMRAAIAAA